MALSSSRMLPSDADRVCRILSSISFSCFLLAALVTIRACRSSSSSGLWGRDTGDDYCDSEDDDDDDDDYDDKMLVALVMIRGWNSSSSDLCGSDTGDDYCDDDGDSDGDDYDDDVMLPGLVTICLALLL